MALTPQQAFIRALALAQKYTDDEVAGGGAIKGKNCTIKSITDIIEGSTVVGHTVTFEWTLDNGTVLTDSMDVMDGSIGLGIKSVAINSSAHFIVTYDDDTTEDAGEVTVNISGISDVDLNNLEDGQILKYNATSHKWENASPGTVDTNLEDLKDVNISGIQNGQILVWDATSGRWVNSANSPAITVDDEISATSENPVQNKVIKTALDGKVNTESGKGLSTNDYDNTEKEKVAAAITKSVNDLVNYYLKTETYTKTEVDTIAAAIRNSRFEVVSSLPVTDIHTNVIYLVPKTVGTTVTNIKDEYINLDGTVTGWEKIGDTEIDLSDYVTTTALNTALEAYTTTVDLTTLLSAKADKVTGATNGNFAGLDSNGNLTDSGYKAGEMTEEQWTAINNALG